MTVKNYIEIELNTVMDAEEVKILKDSRFMSNINTAQFTMLGYSITVTTDFEDVRTNLALIANWLGKAVLAEHIVSVRMITDYRTDFMDQELSNVIKVGKLREERTRV
jgi:hypothetical protein